MLVRVMPTRRILFCSLKPVFLDLLSCGKISVSNSYHLATGTKLFSGLRCFISVEGS